MKSLLSAMCQSITKFFPPRFFNPVNVTNNRWANSNKRVNNTFLLALVGQFYYWFLREDFFLKRVVLSFLLLTYLRLHKFSVIQEIGFVDSLSRERIFPTFSFKWFFRIEEFVIKCTYDGACCVLDSSKQKLINNTSLSIGKLYNICKTEVSKSHHQSRCWLQDMGWQHIAANNVAFPGYLLITCKTVQAIMMVVHTSIP